ncbi:hypothetical protein HPSA20_0082 [Helicobacter pylori SouthAfrica20]|uniref:Uncharacterized protein n=1 Tax=Helicobacter pylori SouthAfrica20 TaxID=1352356 RepID=T1U8S4_HELPX|nr:hypothetical protein HPSA20_0082 [Helicobacter pylori SouthAfrica20]
MIKNKNKKSPQSFDNQKIRELQTKIEGEILPKILENAKELR